MSRQVELISVKSVSFILMKYTGIGIQDISSSFEDEGGFPGVIGLIDGTHIRIRVPQHSLEAYINRKKIHSECSGNVTTGQENSNGLFLLNIGFYSANGLHYPTLLILTGDIILKEIN